MHVFKGKGQSVKATYCAIPTIRHSRKGKTNGEGEKVGGCQGLRGGRQQQAERGGFLGQ